MNTEKFQPLSAARLGQGFLGQLFSSECIMAKWKQLDLCFPFYVHQYKPVELHYRCEEGPIRCMIATVSGVHG